MHVASTPRAITGQQNSHTRSIQARVIPAAGVPAVGALSSAGAGVDDSSTLDAVDPWLYWCDNGNGKTHFFLLQSISMQALCEHHDNYQGVAQPFDLCDQQDWELEVNMMDCSAHRSPNDESLEKITRRLLGVKSGLLAGQVEGFSRRACNAMGQFGKEDNTRRTQYIGNNRETYGRGS